MHQDYRTAQALASRYQRPAGRKNKGSRPSASKRRPGREPSPIYRKAATA